MLMDSLILLSMIQLPDVDMASEELKYNFEEGIHEASQAEEAQGKPLTLEDLDAENKRHLQEAISTQLDLEKTLDSIYDYIPGQPPKELTAYNVALAEVMTQKTDKLFAFAQYKGALPIENLGEDIRLGNSEARMATLEVSDKIQTVAEYYTKELFSRGVLPRLRKLYENTLGITFREPDGFMRSLTLVGFDDQTVVFAAVTDARKVYEGVLGQGAQAENMWNDWKEPIPEEAPRVFFHSDSKTKYASRTILVRDSSIENVVQFYRRELNTLGWTMMGEPLKQNSERTLMFSKESKTCSLAVKKQDDAFCEVLTTCQVVQGQY